jgi:NTE family protein
MKQKIKVGLALGGGGARGLAHIGVLKALEEEKIPIHAIAGTSMGAVVGGAYAQMSDSRKLILLAHDLIDKFDLKSGWMKFLSHEGEKNKEKKESLLKELGYFVRRRLIYVVGASRISLEHQEKLMEPLKTAVRDEPIENAKIPFAAVAIDLVSGREVVIKKRSMINALYASSSIEGIFPPLRLDNQLLSDGGVASLVPVDAVRELGANFVIGVSIPEKIRQETEFGSGIEVILRADALTRNKLNDLMLKDCDVVITPEVRTIHWANFGKLDECIQKGYDATKSKIKEIKEKMERKRSLWNKVRKSLAQAIAGKE